MTKRRAWRLSFAAVVLAVLPLLIPGSPLYLPNLLGSGRQYEGHSADHWTKALNSPDSRVRLQAIFALGAIGAEAGDAVPALATILREDRDPEARSEAALALSKMDPASRAAVPALAHALADKEPIVRMYAALALARLREEARPAVPALIKAVQDEDNFTNLDTFTVTIQEAAVLALGRASAGTPEGVPALTEALEGGTQEMRLAAARALGEVGTEARSAAPQLRVLLKDKNDEVRQTAEETLRKIEGEAAVGGLVVGDRSQANAADLELPEAEREYIWDIEHHGNVLVKFGFGPLAQALKGADAAALFRLLADDFAGTDLREPHRVRAVTDCVEVERLQDAGHPSVPLGRDAFIARLLEFRRVFRATPPQVKLALMTLGPKVRGQLDGIWEGTGQLRLYGDHAKGAPAEVVVLVRYEVARPTQEALSQPGWLRAASVQQVLTAKASHPLFAEVAQKRGIDPSKLHDTWTSRSHQTITGGVYVCDFDRDGILDVLVTDANGSLYRGRVGGTYEDVTERCGLPQSAVTHAVAAWADLDGDGWEDLLLGGRVFRNEEGRRFADYSERCNLRIPGHASNLVVADYDRDGKLDLYVTRTGRPGGNSWLEGKSGDPRGNILLRNKGDWQFEDVSKVSGARGRRLSTFTAAWLDANDDGWPDLHVINEFGNGTLLVNKGDGTFTEHTLADRPADFGSMGLAVGDVNNDGRIDIYCANMYSKAGTRVIGNLRPDAYAPEVMEKLRRFVAGSQLHLNKGGLKFEQVGKEMQVAAVGWAYGASLADLDNDGWLDIYATAGFVSRSRDEPDG